MGRPGPGRLDIQPLHSSPGTLAVMRIGSEQLGVCSNWNQVPCCTRLLSILIYTSGCRHTSLTLKSFPSKGILPRAFSSACKRLRLKKNQSPFIEAG